MLKVFKGRKHPNMEKQREVAKFPFGSQKR